MFYRIALGLLALMSFATVQATPKVYMVSYPIHIEGDMNLFVNDIYQSHHQVDGQLMGMILKVAQINLNTTVQVFNKSCTVKNISPFFNGCITKHNAYRGNKANFIALIQLVQSTKKSADNIALSVTLADNLADKVISDGVTKYFSGFMLDIETFDQSTIKGRQTFFTNLLDKLGGTGLPIGVYINPNTTDFTKADAIYFNGKLVNGNYYMIPLYGKGTSATSLKATVGKITSPFKFIVDVNTDPAKQLAMIKGFVTNKCYYGLNVYQYANSKTVPFKSINPAYLAQITAFIKAHPAKPSCH